MTIVAREPRSPAAIATACAWLPEEYARTPRRSASSSSDEILLYAPRNLKAPPRWKHSAFTWTCAPVRASRVREVTTGVRWATPASRCAARSTSPGSMIISAPGSSAGAGAASEEAESPEPALDDVVGRARVCGVLHERLVAVARHRS